ncbi:mCG142569, partial [Mus musculus]
AHGTREPQQVHMAVTQPGPLKYAQIAAVRLSIVWQNPSDMCSDEHLVYLIKHCGENGKQLL